MAKKIGHKMVMDFDELEVDELPTELPNAAFSIIYNGKKKYSVVKIQFAAGSTNSAGAVETIAKDLDIYEAHHEFKKATVNAGLFDQGVDKTE